jgi:hypothetical protein
LTTAAGGGFAVGGAGRLRRRAPAGPGFRLRPTGRRSGVDRGGISFSIRGVDMKKTIERFVGLGIGVATLALVGVSSASAGSPMTMRTTHETVSVVAIDRATRAVTLQNVNGETKTVKAPADMKSFDTLKVGDRVDIDYTEAAAVSLAPAGTKPSISESASGMKTQGSSVSGSREMTASAEVLAVDRVNNRVTFKGPSGDSRTVSVTDPALQKKLASLKPGQVIQITYTEAMAASIRPSSPMGTPKP